MKKRELIFIYILLIANIMLLVHLATEIQQMKREIIGSNSLISKQLDNLNSRIAMMDED
jgi:regulatory protein YycI of two-component signal transduction system YycFG